MLLLTADEKQSLLRLSRATLEAAFQSEERAPLVAFESDPHKMQGEVLKQHPCFVTLETKAGRLRGCIGSMVAFNPLYLNVFHMTRQAAFEDPRFRAVVEAEIADLLIHIAVLGPLRPLPSLDGLELGQQGLQVIYGTKRGVLLASVAIDNGFTKEEFLRQTCIKAGLDPVRLLNYEIQTFDEISFGEST